MPDHPQLTLPVMQSILSDAGLFRPTVAACEAMLEASKGGERYYRLDEQVEILERFADAMQLGRDWARLALGALDRWDRIGSVRTMSKIRANLVEAAVRAEVEHVEAGHRARAALRRLTDDERQAALIEASERVLARIRASFAEEE